MLIDTDKLDGLTTDEAQLAIRKLTHHIIIKSFNVRVVDKIGVLA